MKLTEQQRTLLLNELVKCIDIKPIFEEGSDDSIALLYDYPRKELSGRIEMDAVNGLDELDLVLQVYENHGKALNEIELVGLAKLIQANHNRVKMERAEESTS